MKNIIILFIMFFILSSCNRLLKDPKDVPGTVEWCVVSWANEAAESADSRCSNYPEIQALDRYKAQTGQLVGQRIKGLEQQIESLTVQLANATNQSRQLATGPSPPISRGYVLYNGKSYEKRYDTESGCLIDKQQKEENASRDCEKGGLYLLACLITYTCKRSSY